MSQINLFLLDSKIDRLYIGIVLYGWQLRPFRVKLIDIQVDLGSFKIKLDLAQVKVSQELARFYGVIFLYQNFIDKSGVRKKSSCLAVGVI